MIARFRSLARLTIAAVIFSLLATSSFATPSTTPTDTDAPATQPSDAGPWHKIKSAKGPAKNKATAIKFKVNTKNWRLTLHTTALEEQVGKGNVPPSIRVGLMTESLRDVDDLPVNWTQVEVMFQGKPGESGSKMFDTGLDKDGNPKWFEIVISGHRAHYELVVEDQSADDSVKASKSRKKKSDS
jgi:hypothetical protein